MYIQNEIIFLFSIEVYVAKFLVPVLENLWNLMSLHMKPLFKYK